MADSFVLSVSGEGKWFLREEDIGGLDCEESSLVGLIGGGLHESSLSESDWRKHYLIERATDSQVLFHLDKEGVKLVVGEILRLCSNEVASIIQSPHIVPVEGIFIVISLSSEQLERRRELVNDASSVIWRNVIINENDIIPVSVDNNVFHPFIVRHSVFDLAHDVTLAIKLHQVNVICRSVGF